MQSCTKDGRVDKDVVVKPLKFIITLKWVEGIMKRWSKEEEDYKSSNEIKHLR
jgi:hypothetical protein